MSELRAAAIARLHQEEALDVGEWAAVVVAIHIAGGRAGAVDPAIRATAALARQHLHPHEPTPLLVAAAQSGGDEISERRLVAQLLTRHAATTATGVDQVMLLASEQRLASNEPGGASPAALTRWADLMAVAGPELAQHPTAARTVAMQQARLLRRATQLLDEVTVDDAAAVSKQRLLLVANRALDTWTATAAALADRPETQSMPPRLRLGLTEAARGVAAELRAQRLSPPSAQLHAIFAQDAAITTTAAAMARIDLPPAQVQQLLDDSRDLSTAMLLIEANSPGAFSDERVHQDVSAVARHVVGPMPDNPALTEGPRAAASLPARQPPPDTAEANDTTALTAEQAVQLAGRRDLGIAAQAAIDGVPDAVRLFASVDSHDVHQLAADGRVAMARLVAGVYNLAGWHARPRGLPEDVHNDAVQRMLQTAAQIVPRWDPQIGAWSTFASSHMTWTLLEAQKEHAARESQLLREGDAPLEAPMSIEPDSSSVDRVSEERLQARIDQLDPQTRGLLRGRIYGSLSYAALAAQFGIDRSTARRRIVDAVSKLQRDGSVTFTQDSTARRLDEIRNRLHAAEGPSAPPPPETPPGPTRGPDISL